MSDISAWSNIAGNNNATPPNGFPEGQDPATLNDACREVMASVRRWYQGAGWTNLGNTPTYVSAISFSVTGDQTAFYTANRRIKIYSSTAGTLYGNIVSSAYSTVTTVTVNLDSGSLDANIATVWLCFLEGDALIKTGTWTPTLIGSTTNPTVSYNFQTGQYIKQANWCTIMGRVSVGTVTSAGAGNLDIGGLPFTPRTSPDFYAGCLPFQAFSGQASRFIGILTQQGSTSLSLWNVGPNVDFTRMQTSNLVAGWSAIFQLSYLTY